MSVTEFVVPGSPVLTPDGFGRVSERNQTTVGVDLGDPRTATTELFHIDDVEIVDWEEYPWHDDRPYD